MADGEAIPATVPVAVSPVPFHSREPRLLEVREGMTVRAALVEAVRAGILPVDDLRRVLPRTRVLVNGEELDRETAMDVRLAANDIVNFEVAELGGGGGSKDFGQILLTIATIAVSAWVGSMVMFPTMVRAVASAAIMAGGNALGAALFAPEKGSSKVNDRYALQSASNQYRPWAPFPCALGEVVVAPDLVVKTFTRNVGDEVWIHGILGLHYGACEVAEEKIGDTLISSMGAGEVQLVKHLTPGPRTFTLYPNDVDQLDLTGELEATTSSATPIVRASSSEGERFDFHFFFAGGLYFQKDDGRVLTASVTLSVRYREVDENGDPVGSGAWTTGPSWPVSSTSKEPLRITRGISLPMGRYEFEVQRSVKPDDNDKRRDRVVWSALQSIAYRKPVVDETLSLIEFAVKATSLNQGTLAPITCRIKPKFPTWTGTEWGPETPSSNPAAVARWLLTGPAPAKPLDPAEADVRLREWSTLCDQYGWRVGVYLQDEKTQSEALGLLERAGRASLFWDGTQIAASPWVEKPAPRQLFAGDNLRDHQWRIVYPEPVHALRVEFQNIDEGGEPDEVYVYADGYGETAGPGVQAATLVEALRLDGQMTPERAYKDGRWALASRLHQRRIDTWTAPVEHLVSGYGDRVRLAWSRVDGGFDARVRCRRWSGGLVSGLRLTRPVEMLPGKSYALDLRLTSGVATSVPIINPAVSDPVVTREVFFADPRAEAAAPRAGDKVAFGVPTRISEDVELIGIEPGEDLTAALTGIRYVAPLLMAAETGPVPPLQTRLSRARAASPPPPRLLGVQPDPSGVRVSFDMPPWSGSPLAGFSARWRPTPPVGLETSWLSLAALGATARTLVTPPPGALPVAVDDVEGRTLIDIEIRAFTEAGQSSPTPLLIEGVEVREDPFAPTNLTVTPATRTAPDGSSHGVLIVAADPLAAAVGVDMIVEVRRYPPVGDPDPWESAGLPLTAANPVGDILGLRAATTYGVRAAWRTAGGWPSGWTAEVTGTVPAGSNVAGDTTPIVPATVAVAPTLSIATAIAPDGTQVSRLAASWAAAVDAVSYIVEIDDGVATWSEPSTEAALADRIVATGKTYRVRTKGVSRTGHLSADWSPWSLSVAAGGDTTAPGPITSPTVTPLARRNVLSWTNPTDADFSRVKLYRNTVDSTATMSFLGEVRGNIYPDTNVSAGVTYYYWAVTVDRTGNEGGFTALGSAAPFYIRIDKGDVEANDPGLVTQYGISAGFTGQGGLATRSDVDFDTHVVTYPARLRPNPTFGGAYFDPTRVIYSTGAEIDALRPGEFGANITENRTAAAIVGQAPTATDSSFGALTSVPVRLRANPTFGETFLDHNLIVWSTGNSLDGLRPAEFGSNITENRTAAAIAGQSRFATAGIISLDDSDVQAPWAALESRPALTQGNSLTEDQACGDAAAWSFFNCGIETVGAGGKVSPTSLRNIVEGYGQANSARRIPVDLSKTYQIEGWFYRGGTADGSVYGGVDLQDGAGGLINGDGTYWLYNPAAAMPTVGVWTYYSKTFGAGTDRPIPSNAKTMGLVALLNYNGTVGYCYTQGLRIVEVVRIGGSLYRADGTLATEPDVITAQGTAAAFQGQGSLATRNDVDFDTHVVTYPSRLRPNPTYGGAYFDPTRVIYGTGAEIDALRPAEFGSNVTENRTAAAIASQGPGATAAANRVLNDRYDGGVRYISYPDGGQYLATTYETGQIQIVLPYGFNDAGAYAMIRFTVDIYDYNIGRTVSYVVGGYTYNASGVGAWYNHSASYIGPRTFARPVKFGFYNGKAYIWIGSVGDSWAYASVRVRDVQISYSGAAATGWSSGWSVSLNNTDISSLVYAQVTVPKAGDAVFGENALEDSSGAVATLPNFKTGLGTAAAIVGQAPTATDSSFGALTAVPTRLGASPDYGSTYLDAYAVAFRASQGGATIGDLRPGEAGANVTESRTAAAIVSQGPLATSSLTPAQVQGRYFGEYAGDAAANAAGLQNGDLYVDSSVFPKALKVKTAGVVSEVDTSGMSTGVATQFDLTSTSFVDVATKALTNIQVNSFVTLWFTLDVETAPGRTRKVGGTAGVNPSGTWQIVEVATAGGAETIRMSGSWSATRIGDGPNPDYISNFQIDGSGNVSDVSKRWRVANTGSVTWKLQMKLAGAETLLDFGATLLVQIQRNPAT